MTDKQIIIDGIDVTGCEYCSRYADTTIYHCDWIGECKEHPNCLYKQLKRAENQIVDLNKMVEAKEQECEELKKKCNIYTCGICGNKEYCNKLYKTLTEIKPILEYYANSTLGEEQEDGTYRIELSYKYGSSNMYGAPCYYKYNPKPARQALQKISEVEDETTK